MKAEEFLKEKYKKGGCYPWSQFDIKEMVENMEEFAAQQVKLLDLHSVMPLVCPDCGKNDTERIGETTFFCHDCKRHWAK